MFSSVRGILPVGNRMIRVGSHMGTFGILWMILMIILWAVLITVLVLVMIKLLRHSRHDQREQSYLAFPPAAIQTGVPAASSASVRILEERYARGEIGRDEYLERKRDLTGS